MNMRINKITIGLKGQVNMGNNEWYEPFVQMEAELSDNDNIDKSIQLLRLQVQSQLQIDILKFRNSRKIVTTCPSLVDTKNDRVAMSGKVKSKGAVEEITSVETIQDPLRKTIRTKLHLIVEKFLYRILKKLEPYFTK